MVDFNKKLAAKKATPETNPVKLYEKLDRAHDKGPLRPAQVAVLEEWFENRRTSRDVLVKLHTGQGKTLIGLLMLQSRLNEKKGPAVYLCPDNLLIDQTREQAKQFGITTCAAERELPNEFLEGQQILVTSVQKLFNGITRFGLNNRSIDIGTLLMDDAHACSDSIRGSTNIRIPIEDQAYSEIKSLFESDLEAQGMGTYADLCNKKYDALLPIPYWSWIDRVGEVTKILSRGEDRKPIKYAWPLLKDMLGSCQAFISGAAVEIEPYIPPMEMFGSYWKAPHRIFMSATVTDDAFLIKGLRLSVETITKPLTYDKEKWSGEKMIIIPSLIAESLTRTEIVNKFAKPVPNKKFGVVALVPSYKRTRDWETLGATIATKEVVDEAIEGLKKGKYDKTIVLVNRYDGVDLPDDQCRILIFDSKPYSENLSDLYQESCRPNSEATIMRTVRTVEQGMGRSVRGEKDYSAIIIIGPDLVRLVRDMKSRKYLSNQMSTQIKIGLQVADMARDELQNGDAPEKAIASLLSQCIKRDEGWKAFYVQEMDKVSNTGPNSNVLKMFAVELEAEQKIAVGDYAGATKVVQEFLDKSRLEDAEKAWYLQVMARFNYRSNRQESNKYQVNAFNKNRLLLKPQAGVTVTKLTIVSHGRMERIIEWVKKHETYDTLNVAITDILGKLRFQVEADDFESALLEISRALGFVGERPDKEWKEGPDNLWALDAKQYILWECKSEVLPDRAEINKHESGQMDRSYAWFQRHYPGYSVKAILIHPSQKLSSAAAFTHPVEVMRATNLKAFVAALAGFFKSFEGEDFADLSATRVQEQINNHKLSTDSILTLYSKAPKAIPE